MSNETVKQTYEKPLAEVIDLSTEEIASGEDLEGGEGSNIYNWT